ncbi:SOS response-associated peptidase [Rhizosphaericola mali]|uniref:Abasic site processing protein n=1 Tax=Rhizosphaericola mali TaxID=2545455 RepID=A0A5P2G5W1_9BACT|nr:SOS response-associated peptidase family protein [Rhizosphaericola mali]QES88533.1 SOS response-associated peptidase [Rhizosphaericola mali]
MCYHVSTAPKEKLDKFAKNKSLIIQTAIESFYHVSGFARPYLPTILNGDSKLIQPSRWKLLPFWVKTEEDAKKYANTLNAESESIFEKKSYAPYILKNRGLLLVDGFYEPHSIKGKKETENYYLTFPEHNIFSLGIVYAPWTDKETGEITNTFSIITTPANDLLTKIHNVKKRMPLIIPENKWNDWLTADSKPEIENLMQPLEDGILEAKHVVRVTGMKGEDTNNAEIQKQI